jgi:DNA-binding NarL/FixJ family response regulator
MRSIAADADAAPNPATRLLLVDDHVAIREALASVFERQPDFDVVAQASTCAGAIAAMDGIDLAIVDLRLPDGPGSELIPRLQRRGRPVPVLVLTGVQDRAPLARAVEQGAAAVLSKSGSLQEVVAAAQRVRAGETLLPSAEIHLLLRDAEDCRPRTRAERLALAELTAREREVLAALAAGLDTRQVAERLVISVRTERNHIANVLAKLGVRSQLQAVLLALRHGVITLDGSVV